MAGKSRGKYLAKNTLIFALGNFGTKIINFFLVPIYTSILTTYQYGTIDLITTIITVLAPTVILNMGEALMRFPLDKDADSSGITSTGLVFLIFGAVTSLLIIPISGHISILSKYSVYLYLYTVAYACSQLFLCSLRGKERLLQYSIGNIINSFLIATLNIVFLIVLKRGIEGYLSAYIIANFITAMYAMAVGGIIDDIRHFHLDSYLTRNMIKYAIVLLPNTFMWWITNSSDRIMVTAMIGAAANGIYAISYKIPTLLSTIASIFNQAWSYSAIKENESKDREKFNNKAYYGLLAITAIASLGMMLIMKPFLSIYVSKTYYTAWKYTPYLIVGLFFMALGSFLATPYTVYKDSKGFLFSAVTGALINIILNYFLIPKIGVSGAALATCISYISVFFYRIIDTKKYLIIHAFKPKYVATMLLIIAAGFTMYIDGIAGFMLNCCEFLIVIVLYRDITKYFINIVSKKINRVRKR